MTRDPGWFSQPYPPREALRWIANNLWGPSRRHAGLTRWMPSDVVLEAIVPRRRLAFVGDVMPLRGRRFRAAPELRAALADADILIANLEGVLTAGDEPRVFMGQAHDVGTIDFLADLFPPQRTVLSVANNHSGDFGERAFEHSCGRLAAAGFRLVGRRDQPGITLDGIYVAAGTDWSNRPCGHAWCGEPPGPDGPAVFRVLSPHWGYEMEAYPRPAQIDHARELLTRWDFVAGHHSHWPQPVAVRTIDRVRRLIAYSLGNLTFGLPLSRFLRGLALVVEIGPRSHGTWGIGRVRWWRTRVVLDGRAATVRVQRGAGD